MMQDSTLKTVRVDIDGMSCSHCVATVRDALQRVRGAEVQSVEIGRALVAIDGESGSTAAIETAIDETGFRVVAIY